MKQLFSARTGLEAHDIRLFLESRGVKALVYGESGLEVGFSFTPASAPSVYVEDGSLEVARELLAEYWEFQENTPTRSKWTCSNCGEIVGGQFDACWNCETPGIVESDADASIEPVSVVPSRITDVESEAISQPLGGDELNPAERFEVWLEVVVALCVVWVPYFLSGLIGIVWPVDPVHWPFIAESLWHIAGFVPGIAVVLFLIHRGNSPWQAHGFRRPRVGLDFAAGLCICVAALLTVIVVQRVCTFAAGADRWSNEPPSTYGFAVPQTTADYLMVVVLSIAIGFSEELSMRGYLIPKFEQLFQSSAKSVACTSILFASYHLYQGLESAFSILFVGLVYGIAFCLTRRLWPVAIAHAMTDVWAIGATGTP